MTTAREASRIYCPSCGRLETDYADSEKKSPPAGSEGYVFATWSCSICGAVFDCSIESRTT